MTVMHIHPQAALLRPGFLARLPALHLTKLVLAPCKPEFTRTVSPFVCPPVHCTASCHSTPNNPLQCCINPLLPCCGLAQGTYAKVKYGQHAESGEAVAVKVLDKEQLVRSGMVEQIKREIGILKQVGAGQGGASIAEQGSKCWWQ